MSKIQISMRRSVYQALCARAERDGVDVNEVLNDALSAQLSAKTFEDEQAEIKASTRARMAVMGTNPEGAQGEEEEALLEEEAERVLNDEIAEEEMGEAEKEEAQRLKKHGRRNPLLGPSAKEWAKGGSRS